MGKNWMSSIYLHSSIYTTIASSMTPMPLVCFLESTGIGDGSCE
jgi:predicted membrane channel-forming protein YqfA (hemolysin III family)